MDSSEREKRAFALYIMIFLALEYGVCIYYRREENGIPPEFRGPAKLDFGTRRRQSASRRS